MGAFGAKFLYETIPEVNVAAGMKHNRNKMLFAEKVNRYMKNPAIVKPVLYEVVRAKLGPYATDQWFDPVYLATPSKERPSFIEAFKKKWVKMMDSDDFNTIIQKYRFDIDVDAVQLGLAFEQYMRPYLEMAEDEEVRSAAEKAKVARFKKILGGALMAQLIQRHPKPFKSVQEMITVIKDLNDDLGISHRVQPSEQFNVAALMAGKDPNSNDNGNQNGNQSQNYRKGQNGNETQDGKSNQNGQNQKDGKNRQNGNSSKNPNGNWRGKGQNQDKDNTQDNKTERKPYFDKLYSVEQTGGDAQGNRNQKNNEDRPNAKSQGRSNGNSGNYNNGNPRRSPNNEAGERAPRDPSEMTCFRCGVKGHPAKECPTWKLSEQRRVNNQVCTNCLGRRHRAAECKKPKKEALPMPIADGVAHKAQEPPKILIDLESVSEN